MLKNERARAALEETFDIENPEVYVDTVSEDVQIFESDDGKCHVEISAKSDSPTPLEELVEIKVSGNKLSVRTLHKRSGFFEIFRGSSIDLLVTLKLPKTSDLKIKTVSGDVEVGQRVLNLEISAVSGDIEIQKNSEGLCILKTVSGDISTHTFSSCTYKLRSVSGDIRVHVAPGLDVEVDGKTVSGDLESEISLSSSSDSSIEKTESVSITVNTVSGDFTLARN